PQGLHPSSLAPRALCRQEPEVGAECPNGARSVLCGGRSVMSVPTAISEMLWQNIQRSRRFPGDFPGSRLHENQGLTQSASNPKLITHLADFSVQEVNFEHIF